ncbi:N-acetylmuramoyl-L-alanine amidase [Rudaea sp.]|uniref:N-acetylmuramoyl-L-alanine amidase n=1 Tax=Rudaea sp. TaxID=2136325 RepID=UPI0039C8C149
MDLAIHDWPLPYEARLHKRALSDIDLVVIHCTELPDMKTTREYGERVHYPNLGTGNSGHYYIEENGTIYRFVAPERVANHTVGYNTRSIGIEMFNVGRYPHWGDSRYQAFTVPYTKEQINSLLALLRKLRAGIPSLRYISGHENLDRRLEPASDDPKILLPRRQDPGPLFPWNEIVPAAGLEKLVP